MTKQDFELVAQLVRDGRHLFRSNTAHADFAGATAQRLAHTNPRFDGTRFIKACMPGAWVGTTKESAWERAAMKF